MAMEALALYGLTLPQKIIVFIGDGGDGKSSRTILRGNVMGKMHAILSIDVWVSRHASACFELQRFASKPWFLDMLADFLSWPCNSILLWSLLSVQAG